MASEIDPQLQSIKKYFDFDVEDENRQFIIPEFQRAYSWTEEQCEELWTDINIYFQTCGDKKNVIPYFFGCIILSQEEKFIENSDGEEQKVVELKIIDGQQRTITFLLLLKAIQLKIDEFLYLGTWNFNDNKKIKSGLQRISQHLFGILYREKTTDIREYWDEIREKNPVIITHSINEIRSNAGELDLYKILRLYKFEDAENDDSPERVSELRRQGLSRKSMKRFTLFYRNFVYFYNKIGEELTKPEHIKAWVDFFLEKCQIIQIISKDVGQAISMFNALNSKGMNLSDSDLVCSYLAAKSEEKDKKEEYKNNKESYSDIFEKKWEEFVNNVSEMQISAKGRNSDEKEAEKRKTILNQYMYYVRACDKETDSVSSIRDFYNAKIEKGKPSSINFDPIPTCEALIKITQIWEKILNFPAVSVLLKLNSNAQYFLISYLFKYDVEELTQEIVDNFAENLLRLFAILRINGDSYSKSEFKGWLFTNNVEFVKKDNEANITQIFNKHFSEKFDKDEIHDNLREEVDNSIIFLKEYLYAKEHNLLDNFAILPTTEIEHIMPQSGGKYEDIPEDARLAEDEFDLYLNKLGNKILLEANINKHISNNWFRQKKTKKVSDKTGYKKSVYPIALSLVDYPSDMWTKEDIDKVTEEAAESIYKFIFPED